MAQDHPQQMLIFLNQLLGTKRETQGKGRRCGQDDLGQRRLLDSEHLGLELGQAVGPLGAGLIPALQQGVVEIKGGCGTWRRLHPPALGGGHRRHCGTGARLHEILLTR